MRGVTITGGEPLQQISSLTSFLKKTKSVKKIGTTVFTNYNENELQVIPGFDHLRWFIDILITDRFLQWK
ncbi:MAG: 4Fe-4S cluster-binding domain-containing protein [Candidatus Thorarchaeota archaeon]